MKRTNWICWLLFACVCLTEARYKMRRPPLPPPQPPKLVFKKSWPITQRISMGNTMHIGGNFPPKRMPHKPLNYRIRRPPMFNVFPNVWKNQMPIRASLNNHAVLPQRPPVKEFHSMNKMTEYSPEYRPEAAVLPPTHRGGIDDDKGPIHTIPAPNLSPLDRPHNVDIKPEETNQRHHTTDANYKVNSHGSLIPNFQITTSLAPQRTVTSPSPVQHHYEVTESNDINQKDYHTVLPTFLPPEFDVTRGVSAIPNPDLQTNEVFLNHHPANIGLIGTNVQLGQPNTPMQTNLHSSLHVGFPGTAGQAPYLINQQIPDLHVGHPPLAGPPLSATQLYDLLNSLPQNIPEQYQTGQQPQLQQQILQQQLGQFFQPTGVTGFSQPQMQSFNYNEQENKEQQQQQHILVGEEYIAERVNGDYNVGPKTSVEAEDDNNLRENGELAYVADGAEQLENNIDYEDTNNQNDQATYFNKVVNNGDISTQFYTTLPNREAAEKLAALAAAGNVNSQLIGQLRKQQKQNTQSNDSLPPNHKDEDYDVNQQVTEEEIYDKGYQQDEQYSRSHDRQQQRYNQEQYDEQQKQYDRQQVYQHRQRQNNNGSKRPLRIMVPDESEYNNDQGAQKENSEVEYEYENDEDVANQQSDTPYEESNVEFGTRLGPKTG